MSFGWSAGDIAQAITLVVKVARALDNANGAAEDYREAAAFLKSLKRTLEPLQTITSLHLSQSYNDEITEVVGNIKRPIEAFQTLAEKFESSLGVNSRWKGRRKLQWAFQTSKKVEELKDRIEDHMLILNNLLHRLTLDTIVTLEPKLRGEIRESFNDLLHPQLVAFLREQLEPVTNRLLENRNGLEQHHTELLSSLRGCSTGVLELQATQSRLLISNVSTQQQYESLMSSFQSQTFAQTEAVNSIKQHIDDAIDGFANAQPHSVAIEHRQLRTPAGNLDNSHPSNHSLQVLQNASDRRMINRPSLDDLYGIIVVYLGYFLRDILLNLAQMVTPSATLTAKYNVAFRGAIGGPCTVVGAGSFTMRVEFEVVGVIIGGIPLVLKAAEDYREAFEPHLKWVRFRNKFRRFINEVHVNWLLLDSSIERLLSYAELPSEQMNKLLSGESQELWRSTDVQMALERRLGTLYDTFLSLFREIEKDLRKLEAMLSLKNGSVDWATMGAEKWTFQRKQISHGFRKNGPQTADSLKEKTNQLNTLLSFMQPTKAKSIGGD